MQRRTVTVDSSISNQPSEKKQSVNGFNMKLNCMKVFLVLCVLVSAIVYFYLYFRAPNLPFPMSPDMAALYREHGPGEAKQRRRPDINKESDTGEGNEVKNEVNIENKEMGSNMKETENINVEKSKEATVRQQKMEGETGTKVKKEDGELEKEIIRNDKMKEKPPKYIKNHLENQNEKVHIAIVACGDRAPEAIISLKSFAILSKKQLHFYIFAEEELHKEFKNEIKKWPPYVSGQIEMDLLQIQFPGDGDFSEWKKLFKPCASQRMFLPLILTNVDSVIYVDTDVLMLRPPEHLWNFFNKFNKTQLAGLAPEGEVAAIGWYNRFARHPYYGALGLNSGVMLMNLTRMRRVQWNKDIYPIYKQYRYDITWGDQDILNILFHFNPEMLFVFPCDWNYRPDHCMYGINCQSALDYGVSVVHGNRGVFHNKKQPEFKVIYDAFRETKFEEGMREKLKQKIEKGLNEYRKTYCGENGHIFTKLL